MNNTEFLLALRDYIEDVETLIENDRGGCQSLQAMIDNKKMPDIYYEVLRQLETQQAEQHGVQSTQT